MLATQTADCAASDWVAQTRLVVDVHLERILSPTQTSPLTEAMRYSVLAPGKRVRPLLTLAVSDFLGAAPPSAVQVACAVEMIHCASLILDDLPCMDNDRERRNRLSTHVKFGEHLTILAAVSLLTQSYCTIASLPSLGETQRLEVLQLLCETVGPHGLSLGQTIDLRAKVEAPSTGAITDIHHLKTGVLFMAAAKAGCVICDASAEQEQKVMEYTRNIGLAFQLMDDLKDQDEAGLNMVARIGVSNARRRLLDYIEAAERAIENEDNAEVLQNFAQAFIKVA